MSSCRKALAFICMASALAGCETMYNAHRQAALSGCEQLPDWNDRQACVKDKQTWREQLRNAPADGSSGAR